MTEAALMDAVAEAARLLGFIVFHARPARTAKGFRTPVQYDGKGFVDLVIVGNGRVIFAELKSERGRVRFEQAMWLRKLMNVSGVEVYVWRPHDWTSGSVEDILRGRKSEREAA